MEKRAACYMKSIIGIIAVINCFVYEILICVIDVNVIGLILREWYVVYIVRQKSKPISSGKHTITQLCHTIFRMEYEDNSSMAKL